MIDVVLIPGDGIGPEIMDSVVRILSAADCPLQYHEALAGQVALETEGDLLPESTCNLIKKHKTVLKGPLTTPIGHGFVSVTVRIRREFDLYANVRPIKSLPGTRSRYSDIDIVLIRENTEGAYISENQTNDGELALSEIRITRPATLRVARYAYEYARKTNRKKVTIVHKANILKSTSGLFLSTCKEVAKEYPDLEITDMLVDNCAMQLVMNPNKFEVLLAPNLFGDILSDLLAGLVGGLGLAAGSNIGTDYAMYEAVHGTAPDIAGKGLANPCSLLLAACELLNDHGEGKKSNIILTALREALDDEDTQNAKTVDLGGHGTTETWTRAIMDKVAKIMRKDSFSESTPTAISTTTSAG